MTSFVQTEAERQKADVQQRAGAGEPIQDEGDAQVRKSRLQDKFTGVKDSLLGRVPDEHKDRANEHATRAKNFLNDEYFPEERRDQFIFRLKKVCESGPTAFVLRAHLCLFVGRLRVSEPQRLPRVHDMAPQLP